jgi:hypothetical protein
MPSEIGIFVNGWAVNLNRIPNVIVLQTYTPAAELSDTRDLVAVFRSRENSKSTRTTKSKEDLVLFRDPRRAQIALTQRAESKEDIAQFRTFRDSEFVSECQLFDMSRIETSLEVRTEQNSF